jgi:hypothetical protein
VRFVAFFSIEQFLVFFEFQSFLYLPCLLYLFSHAQDARDKRSLVSTLAFISIHMLAVHFTLKAFHCYSVFYFYVPSHASVLAQAAAAASGSWFRWRATIATRNYDYVHCHSFEPKNKQKNSGRDILFYNVFKNNNEICISITPLFSNGIVFCHQNIGPQPRHQPLALPVQPRQLLWRAEAAPQRPQHRCAFVEER